MNLLDLLLLTGHLGRSGCGLAPLAEENNDQGAVEMGTVAEFLPGPGELADGGSRDRVVALWKDEVPQSPGRRLMDILEEARSGTVKAMYIVGENPVGSLPSSAGAREALEKVEFLVCQEVFPTETTELAHVVLPACSYAEKDGTFTNTEGHVQQIRQAIDPIGESRQDWDIFSAISGLMQYPLEYGSAKELLKEIRALIPGYGVLGAGPKPPRPDEAVITRYLEEGYAEDMSTRYRLDIVERQKDALTLVVGQSLFHSGKYSTHAKGLRQVQECGSLALNPSDAERLGIVAGDQVRISSNLGEMTTKATVLDRIPTGLCMYPEHFDDEARRLLSVTLDATTGVPYCKLARVTVERA